MKSRAVIFVAISFLVVASIYSFSSFIPFQASAASEISCNRTGTVKVTCCQDHVINRTPANPAGTLVTYCTDCTVGRGDTQGVAGQVYDCSERYIQAGAEKPPTPVPPSAVQRLQESGVLGEATTLPNLSQSVGPREGVLQTENNLTFSQANVSSNNSSGGILAMEQSDLVSDEVKNTTRTATDGELQDKSGTSEEEAGQDENNEDDVKDSDNNNEDSQPQG